MAKNLYGVFFPNTTGSRDGWKWGMTTNKKTAFAEVKKNDKVEVFALKGGGASSSYDAPTFRVLATRIYPEPATDILPRAVC